MDTSSWRKSILFFINGKKVVVDDSRAVDTTLLTFLRSKGIGLTGTKLGCGEGGCGACTVMVSRYDAETGLVDHRSVNACLILLPSLDGSHIVTVEGLGNSKNPHAIQRRIAEFHGSQCGFCTPGIVMALYAFLRAHPNATKADIEESFDGNLCRCTGYRPILDAAKTFASDYSCVQRDELINGDGESATKDSSASVRRCPGTGLPCSCNRIEVSEEASNEAQFPDSPCDPIFPPFLKTYKPTPFILAYSPDLTINSTNHYDAEGTISPVPAATTNTAAANASTWYSPGTMEQLVRLKALHPEARICVGSSEITIEMHLKRAKYPYPQFLSPLQIPELMNHFEVVSDGVVVGAAVSLSTLREHCQKVIKKLPTWQTRSLAAIVEQLTWFAGRQIRNVACLGGNIATASPISDINPVLVACGAILTVKSLDAATDQIVEREVVVDRTFFKSYRVTSLTPADIITKIKIPFTKEHEFILAYKQSRRKDDDIAIASGAFRLNFERSAADNSYIIQTATLCYGGMAPFTKTATVDAEKLLIGKNLDEIEPIYAQLEKEFYLPPNVPGGMVAFRRSLVLSFFFKFCTYVRSQLEYEMPEALKSAVETYHRPVSTGTQVWEGAHKVDMGPVGKAEVHVSAMKQVTGEAQYVDDVACEGALFAALVSSEEAHAKVLSVDPAAALAHDGVVAYFDYRDIPGDNDCGAVFHDEEIFASKEVLCYGQPIGIVVAKSHKLAQQGAKLVKVQYERLPAILTIDEAIKAEAFYPTRHVLAGGSMDDSVWKSCDHVETGTFTMGGQEHFYLECQTALAIPGEEDEMMVYSSTQNPTKTQFKVASVLGIPFNKVVSKLKRIGGGFGGKETRSVFIACATALAAAKLKTPVRLTLDRDEDMGISGTRHPYYSTYRVGFSKTGKLMALDVEMYSNAGFSHDLSVNVGERSLFSLLSSYQCPNVRARVTCCKTNWPTSTAFRGFGAPQSMMVMEAVMDRITSVVKGDPEEIRALNFSKDGDSTYYSQVMPVCNAGRVWSQLLSISDFEKRKASVTEFNKKNRFIKRGIVCMPTQFGLSFTFKPMNQAGALVHLYTDGTALISTGGVEMGQGLNTKMIQIAAEELGIGMDKVYIAETATDKVPNTMPSAASVTSDLNGMALQKACKELKARLAPYRAEGKSFAQVCVDAHMDRISLSTTGFYATPCEGWNWQTNSGTPFAYFTWGAACSEVEIDCLTGDHRVLRSDIVMDVGQSINPAIDIGQIEGAFAQGYGLTVLEELVTDDRTTRTPGRVFTRGPSTYKIPGFRDIPLQLNVHLLPKSENVGTIHSSKGVGEPPLHLGASIYLAIKRAISAAREEEQLVGDFDLDSPATCERIRMGCQDRFTRMLRKDVPNGA